MPFCRRTSQITTTHGTWKCAHSSCCRATPGACIREKQPEIMCLPQKFQVWAGCWTNGSPMEVSGLGICIWRKQRVRCFDWDSLCPLRFVLCHLGPLRCGTNAGHVSNWCQHSLVKKDLLCYEFRFALWKLSFSSFLRGDILISPLCLSEVWQITFIGCNFFWNNVSYEGDLLQSIFQLVMKLWVFWYR